jgi:hypothetical protein
MRAPGLSPPVGAKAPLLEPSTRRLIFPDPPPPLCCLPAVPFKGAPPLVAARFSVLTPPCFFFAPTRHQQPPSPPPLVAGPPPPARPLPTVGAALHRNAAVPSRPLHPVVVPPPRCVSAGFALPGTSPSSRVSCLRRIPRTSSPGRMLPAAPARHRARGHRAMTTGSARAPRRA